MNYLVITYSVYLILTVILTVWVGRTLFSNGRVFLIEIFEGDENLVDSINKLLLIGFYLINFGYALRNLIIRGALVDAADCIEMLSVKIGLIIIVLGIMHFFNLSILFMFRYKAKKTKLNPAS